MTKIAPKPLEITVDEQNLPLLRRLDRNKDGVIEQKEANQAYVLTNQSRFQNDARAMSPADQDVVTAFASTPDAKLTLFFGKDHQRVGEGQGRVDWASVRERLVEQNQSRLAPLGTVGQERPGDIQNSDCGPASALYIHDRRVLRETGEAPVRTQGEADEAIQKLSLGHGTFDHQIMSIMDQQLGRAGDKVYKHKSEPTSPETILEQVDRALERDPAGVMVSIVDTYNQSRPDGSRETEGTSHWIVVTGLRGDQVSFYDPGGPDGGRHERTMTRADLVDAMPAKVGGGQHVIVYGEPMSERFADGQLKNGAKLAEVDTWSGTSPLRTRGSHGVFADLEKARAEAAGVADGPNQDAAIRKEPNGYAVYGIDEVAKAEGSLWSSNELVKRDPGLVEVVKK